MFDRNNNFVPTTSFRVMTKDGRSRYFATRTKAFRCASRHPSRMVMERIPSHGWVRIAV